MGNALEFEFHDLGWRSAGKFGTPIPRVGRGLVRATHSLAGTTPKRRHAMVLHMVTTQHHRGFVMRARRTADVPNTHSRLVVLNARTTSFFNIAFGVLSRLSRHCTAPLCLMVQAVIAATSSIRVRVHQVLARDCVVRGTAPVTPISYRDIGSRLVRATESGIYQWTVSS